MASSPAAAHRRVHGRRDKVVVIMGATGCGKSRLSMDLASHFPCSEIINSDKMQVYRGLDITTNKMSPADRKCVQHHLIDLFDSDYGEITPLHFRSLGHDTIFDVAHRRGNLPLIVGGSNSFIHALLVEREEDVFGGLGSPATPELKYDCCFLWVHVSPPVLEEYLSRRVDEMLNEGAFEELAGYYDPGRTNGGVQTGLRKAIGVAEFDPYFERYPPRRVAPGDGWRQEDARQRNADPVREGAYQEAVREIKKNARLLAERQSKKIQMMQRCGWKLNKLDATEAVQRDIAAGEEGGGGGRREVWKRQVVARSVNIVKQFWREK